MTATAERSRTPALILITLVALMVGTRLHHFDPIPDASWAVFFIGGFYLRRWTAWAFPLLMALAVVIDYYVISSLGMNFWQHYCMSPAYWFLIPAYFAMWAGGTVAHRFVTRNDGRALVMTAACLLAAVIVCHLLSQGSFYWISSSVAAPTFAGWWKNYSDWFPLYLQTTAIYVGAAAVVHLVAGQVAKQTQSHSSDRRSQ